MVGRSQLQGVSSAWRCTHVGTEESQTQPVQRCGLAHYQAKMEEYIRPFHYYSLKESTSAPSTTTVSRRVHPPLPLLQSQGEYIHPFHYYSLKDR
jgi:hypothetical protein